MPRKYKNTELTGRNILIVDDNQEYLESTAIILKNEGHNVFTSANGDEALIVIKANEIEVVLLDYYMPEMTGEEIVGKIRNINKEVQIILQTGYANENPPRDFLKKLDIQGYYDKSEGIEKLLLWVDVGLKSYTSIHNLNKSRMGMNYILNITPEFHKIQLADDLLKSILFHISGLLGANNSFLSILPPFDQKLDAENVYDSFLAILKEDTGLQIHSGIGKFEGESNIENLLKTDDIANIEKCLQDRKFVQNKSNLFLPLTVGENPIGIIYIDVDISSKEELDLLNIFANQAAVAIQNSLLYEMATLDPLTKVYTRRFFFQLMLKELRSAFRNGQEISILMADVDNLKTINDTMGHLMGDRALSVMGHILHKSCRNSDIIGRYGGDEFAVVLPQTDRAGASIVADKIFEMFNRQNNEIKIGGSIGICSLMKAGFDQTASKIKGNYFQMMAERIIDNVDKMLYKAKAEGKGCYRFGEPIEWITPDEFGI